MPDTMLKVSRLLATGLEILVANAKFSVALATSWSQFRTLRNMTMVNIPFSKTALVGATQHATYLLWSYFYPQVLDLKITKKYW